MPEHDLALGGENQAPRRWPRPRLVPLAPRPDGEPPAREDVLAAEAAELQHLGELLVDLLQDWTRRTRNLRLARRDAGLPALALSWENEIVDAYASRLGPGGADIALALLALSRPRTVTARPVAKNGESGRGGRAQGDHS